MATTDRFHCTDFPQEERRLNSTLRDELSMLEGVMEKSGDQTREELRNFKQMFEQSEQSRNTCELDCASDSGNQAEGSCC